MSSISDAALDRELRKIFSQKSFDMNSETVKTIRARLCKSLGLQEFPSKQKATLKEMIKRILNEKEEEEKEEKKDFGSKKRQLKGKVVPKKQASEKEMSENEVSEEEEEFFKQKKKEKGSKSKEEKKKAPASSSLPYNSDVKSLIELGTAMRMGPNLHRGLKSMDNSKRMEVLTERLEMAGASWKGKIPTKSDVLKAKQERQRLDDLDGLDPSAIVETTGRRRGRAVIRYAYDDDDDEEEKDDEEEEPQRKKTKKVKQDSSDDDDDVGDDNDFDGESSSEDEFSE